jgi:F-type H+-transporting ATPase subunit epsilon
MQAAFHSSFRIHHSSFQIMALQLDVITPERRLLSEQADSVTVPGAGGELGILPGHTPLISELQTGMLSYTRGAETRRLMVSGGFVEVNDDRISVLADLAEFPQEIDAVRARAERDEAEKRLGAFNGTPEELTEAQTQLDLANTRLQLAAGDAAR